MSLPTLGDLRRELAKVAHLPDDTEIASDVSEGPDGWSATVEGFTGGVPDAWKGVSNFDELPRTLWITLRVVDMEEMSEEDDEDDEDDQEDDEDDLAAAP